MANVIHCCETPDGPRFRVWSTIVDCYTTEPLTREEMRDRLVDDEVRAARRFAEERLSRAQHNGTSAHDHTRDTSAWDVERCDGCGGFHHEWEPSGHAADHGHGEGCRQCGLVRSDRAHGTPCAVERSR